MRNIKLTIEYDGTNYCGWQVQNDQPTIQGCLQRSIQLLTGETTHLHGAGRTDSGVHAWGQVANFRTTSTIPEEAFAKALNSLLPKDIVICNSCEVAEEFHSQYCSRAKAYRYRILCREACPAIERNYVYWIRHPLSAKEMEKASLFLLGTHDFSAFESANSPRKSNIRTVNSIDICQRNWYIEIVIEANGFLYRMVRNIVGTLLEVGCGRRPSSNVREVLLGKDRTRAGPTAPARGLFLEYVVY